jgi:hypothetical protein
MIALKIGNSIYHFVPRNQMQDKGKRPTRPKGLSERPLWFGTSLLAETLLRRFIGDRSASGEVAKLLRKEGEPLVLNPHPSKWVPHLAGLLVSGDVVVIEMMPQLRDVATKSTKAEGPLRVPRKAPVVSQPEEVEQDTFPLVLNEDEQTQALTLAALAGAPFCEVCSRTTT